MARVFVNQKFETYIDEDPAAIKQAIQTAIAQADGWYIHEMGVLQYATKVAVWALWQREEVV